MRKSPQGRLFYKSKMYVAGMLCMILFLAGCDMDQMLQMTGEELFAQAESESILGQRTLSLERLEYQAAQRDISESAVSADAYSISDGDCLLFEGGSTYAKDGLSEKEKLWYRDMELILGNVQEGVKLSEAGLKAGLDESDVDKIFQSVLNDHPELFYVEGYSYTKYTRGGKTVAIEFTGTYNQDKGTVYDRKREIEAAVEEILRPARKLEDDYEKIKYVYELLIEQTEYDVDSRDNQNIYSVFVNQASVCQGYAKAFQYLMYRLDVECALIQGKVIDTGEGHAWNLVKSNGEYYYVDATWGDISYQSDAQNNAQRNDNVLPGISYDYLCITTDELLRTHILKEEDAVPECTAVADNYYVREGAQFEQYDETQLANLIERRLSQGENDIALRCSNEDCYKEMREALLDRQEIFTYLAGSGIQTFVYTCNDRQLTLTFFMMTSQR